MRRATLVAGLHLVRPLNLVILVAGVVLGGVLAAPEAAWMGREAWPLAIAAFAAALVGAGGNVYNDLRDLAIDAVNRPARPLPAGHVSVRAARVLWAGLTLAGVACALGVSAWHGLVAAGVAIGLVGYSRDLKKRPLVGNLAVAVLIAVALLFGAEAVGAWHRALVGAAFAFLTTLAREVVKDVEDVPGDAPAGARTLPVVVGTGAATRVAQGLVALTVALLPVPYLALDYEPIYLPVVLGSAALLVAAAVRLHRPQPRALRAASRALKGAMVVGIGALAAGAPL